MALTLSTAARSDMAVALRDLIDNGAGAILRILESSTTLVDIALDSTTSFTESGGVLTMDVTPNPSGTAVATASVAADNASILDAVGGNVVISGLTVGATGSGEDLELSNTAIVSGGTVSITGGTITVPAS